MGIMGRFLRGYEEVVGSGGFGRFFFGGVGWLLVNRWVFGGCIG